MKITRDTQATARRLFRLCMVDGLLDDNRVRRISRVITQGKLRNKLPLLVAFTRLVKIQILKREAVISSAVPLTEAEKETIAAKLESKYGKGLSLTWDVNESLIAGIRIKVADDVTDGSVKMRINKLQNLTLR